MRSALIEAPAATVRAAIARAWLRADEASAPATAPKVGPPRTLGRVILRPHQIDAARRLADAIASYGGALLADEVGLGKTYTALAVARTARRLVVVAPAALRDMWRAALARTCREAAFVSFERLSRVGDDAPLPTDDSHDFVLVDEAHHARNPATRRYRALARLTERASVLLLSATPVHNRRADLDALLALFLGARARALDDRDLARVVVRRGRSVLDARTDEAEGARTPDVAPLRWLHPPADDAVLDALLSLPPPLPARGGGDGGALVVHALARQWASSIAALRAAVARRLGAAAALADALERGRYPDRADLRAWVVGTDAVQLAFAELVADPAPVANAAELLAVVRAHEQALRSLDARLRSTCGASDDARAALLADVVERHRGAKVVAFASYAETVSALFRGLRNRARVAALSGAGAAVAGGRIARRDALARFAPEASGAPSPQEADRVDLLLATDLLSEGVNLQDASVVVHLDLPWTPARLEQRVGRAARLGSRHDVVHVYAMAPPATAERVLAVEVRLRAKARVAGAAIGAAFTSPFLTASAAATRSPPADAERLRALLREWLAGSARGNRAASATPLVAAVRAAREGFLALCVRGATADARAEGEPFLLAALDDTPPTDRPGVVADAAALAGGDDVRVDPARVDRAVNTVDGWAAAREAAEDAGVEAVAGVAARRRVLDRVASIARRAPHHRRAAVATLCRDARRALLAPLGAGAERRLESLARSPLADDAWLRAVVDFGSTYERSRERAPGVAAADAPMDGLRRVRVLALLQLIADP